MSEALSSASVTVKSTIDAATDAISSAISSDSQANPVATLITQIRKDKVKAVFMENIKDSRLLKQIADGSRSVDKP